MNKYKAYRFGDKYNLKRNMSIRVLNLATVLFSSNSKLSQNTHFSSVGHLAEDTQVQFLFRAMLVAVESMIHTGIILVTSLHSLFQ